MRKIILVIVLFPLLLSTGCAMSDALFAVFGDHYTGGGITRTEKERHFNQQIESAQSHSAFN